MKKYCPNCHKELPENSKFCRYCGAQIPDEGTPEPEKNGVPRWIFAVAAGVLILIIGGIMFFHNSNDAPVYEPSEAVEPEEADDSEDAESRAPSDAVEFEGRYYKVFNDSKTWKKARQKCEDEDGHLVTITSKDEQKFVEELLDDDGLQRYHYWIGATDKEDEGRWEWVTGEDMDYENFGSNKPNNNKETDPDHKGEDYAEMKTTYPEYMTWNDVCNSGVAEGYEGDPYYYEKKHFGYICEWDNEDQ